MATVQGLVSKEQEQLLATGIELSDGFARAESLEVVDSKVGLLYLTVCSSF